MGLSASNPTSSSLAHSPTHLLKIQCLPSNCRRQQCSPQLTLHFLSEVLSIFLAPFLLNPKSPETLGGPQRLCALKYIWAFAPGVSFVSAIILVSIWLILVHSWRVSSPTKLFWTIPRLEETPAPEFPARPLLSSVGPFSTPLAFVTVVLSVVLPKFRL